jgi:RhoGEF domain
MGQTRNSSDLSSSVERSSSAEVLSTNARSNESDAALPSPLRAEVAPSSSSAASSSSSLDSPDAAKQQRQLEAVLREIVETEIDYCKDLDVLSEIFFLPLQIRSKEIGVTKADVEVLFSNLELLRNLHQKVMEEFEELKASGQDGTPGGVGSVLMKMSQYFKMYTQYSTNQPAALRRLEYLQKNVAGFRKFVEIATADPRCRGLQFGGYLIKVCFLNKVEKKKKQLTPFYFLFVFCLFLASPKSMQIPAAASRIVEAFE